MIPFAVLWLLDYLLIFGFASRLSDEAAAAVGILWCAAFIMATGWYLRKPLERMFK